MQNGWGTNSTIGMAKMDCNKEYVQEMLEFAKSLKGRELTPVEEKIWQEGIESKDDWHYFMVFGIQADTQKYINKTIRLLEECEDIGDEVICENRLEFTVEEMGIEFPEGSLMRKHWDDYKEWKRKKDGV